jgi:hypothetical protein
MNHPLDHDGDGKAGGSLPKAKRGRPAKVEATGKLKVLKADTIHDGEGGFLPVGAAFDAVDDDAAESLKAKGHAE